IHRAWVVDVVGRDERSVDGAGTVGVERLIKETPFIAHALPVEEAIPPFVLAADVGAQVLPLRTLRIDGRIDRVGSDMTNGARHADAVRPKQTRRVVIV